MNIQKLLITMLCIIALAIAAQANGMYSTHHQTIHATLRNVGEYTQEYKIPFQHDQAYKFTFSLPHTFATAYFDNNEDQTFTIKSHQVIRNLNEAEEEATLVFKLYTTSEANVGKMESVSLYAHTKPHVTTDEIMAHKNFILVPLYICIVLTGVLSAAFLIVFVGCVAKTLTSKKSRNTERMHLLSAHHHQPSYSYNTQPMMYQAQPIPYPSFHTNMRYYTLGAEEAQQQQQGQIQNSQMYPSVDDKMMQAGESQQE